MEEGGVGKEKNRSEKKGTTKGSAQVKKEEIYQEKRKEGAA